MKKEEMRRILERADSLAELLRKALSERRYDEALILTPRPSRSGGSSPGTGLWGCRSADAVPGSWLHAVFFAQNAYISGFSALECEEMHSVL